MKDKDKDKVKNTDNKKFKINISNLMNWQTCKTKPHNKDSSSKKPKADKFTIQKYKISATTTITISPMMQIN